MNKEILKKYKDIIINDKLSFDWIENEYFLKYHDPIVDTKDINELKKLDIFLTEYKDLLEYFNSYYEFKINTELRFLPFPNSESANVRTTEDLSKINDWLNTFYNEVFKYKQGFDSIKAMFLYFYYHIIQSKLYYTELKDSKILNEILEFISSENDYYSELMKTIKKIEKINKSSLSKKSKDLILNPIKKEIIYTNQKWNKTVNLSDIQTKLDV